MLFSLTIVRKKAEVTAWAKLLASWPSHETKNRDFWSSSQLGNSQLGSICYSGKVQRIFVCAIDLLITFLYNFDCFFSFKGELPVL